MKEEDRWHLAVRSYLACINWVDKQIGRVLDALDESPYADNTIIMLYADHGYHLGEKQRWSKFSLWERTTRVPFIGIESYSSSVSSGISNPLEQVKLTFISKSIL